MLVGLAALGICAGLISTLIKKRQATRPDLAWYVRDPDHPATKFSQLLFAFGFLPILAIVLWFKVSKPGPVDPNILMTRNPVDIHAGLGADFRIFGSIFLTLAFLLLLAVLQGAYKKRVPLRQNKLLLWIALWIAISGAAPFEAARNTERAFLERGTYSEDEIRGNQMDQFLRRLYT